MTDRKKKMVQKAFSLLDRHNRGFITVSDIVATYDVSKDKEFLSGQKTKEQILTEFLNSFEGLQSKKDGTV